MSKTFAEYKAEHTKAPYPFPMPDGASIMIAQPTIDQEQVAVAAANADGGGLLAGVLTYVSPEDAVKISEAWGSLPATALGALVEDMRKYFSAKSA